MKKEFILIAGALLILVLIGAWFFWSKSTGSSQQATSTPSFPAGSSSSTTQTGSSNVSSISNNTDVSAALAKQLPDSHFGFYGSIIVMPYALQNWGDDNTENQALLKYDATAGWTVINTGGGAWDVASLESQGVSATIAVQLIVGEK